MATIFENLNIIREQKQAIKNTISAMGFEVSSLPFTEYASKLNEVKDERIEIKNALSAAGIDVTKDLSSSIVDVKDELSRLSNFESAFNDISSKYDELSAKYDEYVSLNVEIENIVNDILDV